MAKSLLSFREEKPFNDTLVILYAIVIPSTFYLLGQKNCEGEYFFNGP